MSPFILYSLLFTVSIYFLLHLRSLLSRRRLPPGPRPWPLVGNLPHLGPVPHHSIAALARKHGPLMHLRLGFVDVVVAASASVAAQFLKAHDANFSSRPPNSGAKHIAYNYQDLVFAPYGPRWRLLRKISSVHLFSAKALDDFRHIREGEVAILTRSLAGAGQTPVQLGQLLTVCVTNALGRVMLGRRVFGDGSGGGDAQADDFKSMVVEMMVLAGVFNVGDFVPALEWLDLQGVAAKMKKLHKRFDGFLGKILEEHRVGGGGGGEKHADLLSTLISLKENADGEGGKLNDTEIKALLLNMFSAGTDTSSSTVEWAIAELLRHPNILARKLNMEEAYGLTLQRAEPLLVHPRPRLSFLIPPTPITSGPMNPINLPSLTPNSTTAAAVPPSSPLPPKTPGFPAKTDPTSSSCHGVFYNAVLVVPAVLFVVYLGINARKSVAKLWNGRSHGWQCVAEKEVGWNLLSMFATSAMLCLEMSIVGFLLQDSYSSGLDTLSRTFVVSGVAVAVDFMFKAIYVFGFRVPLFIDTVDSTQRMKWGLWIIQKLLLTAVYGYILFVHFSKWREKLPPRPSFYNYIIVMFSEEDFLLDNAYYSEMKDAGFFDADWD
ncbi:hypothetical protein Tsubulata_050263 [Turnera subulata]|uniref:Flavonoid 3'-monooxygenase n=1 Tax=Turnera subulata TaxID=218843 RepID=A0A9Q0JNA3_9ROSI|nr:hypothetical protein Tsubulata_050263 [Turnera subulata]